MAKKKALIKQSNKVSESAEIFNQRVDAWLAKYPSMDIRETKYIDLFGQIPLSELLVYDIHRSELAVTGKDGKVDIPTPKEFKKAFDRLADNALIYGTPDDDEDWMRINIIGSVKWDKNADCMHIKQHEDIVKEHEVQVHVFLLSVVLPVEKEGNIRTVSEGTEIPS